MYGVRVRYSDDANVYNNVHVYAGLNSEKV